MARRSQPIEVVNLVSDDEDSDPDTPPLAIKRENSPARRIHAPLYNDPSGAPPVKVETASPEPPQMEQQDAPVAGEYIYIDGKPVFIPDEPAEHDHFNAFETDPARDEQLALALANGADLDTGAHDHDDPMDIDMDDDEVTQDTCLQQVLAIFPDISHDHVIDLYTAFDREGDYEVLPGRARLDNIIEQLVSSESYPKQEKGKRALKRKREDSIDGIDFKKWEKADRAAVPNFLKGSMQVMLKSEFPEIPVQYINAKLATERHLYNAFTALAKEKDDSERDDVRRFGKGRPSQRQIADADTIATNCGWPELLEELNAARARMVCVKMDRAAEDAKKIAERENLDRAIAAGETAECSACFDDLPMNRQIHCNGSVAHFLCFDCALTYIKTEVGESRCNVLCTAGCGAGFAGNQLKLLSDKQLLEKLSQLEQEKAIREAGLDDLEECPFCDYKAILPPIEEDFEFRCANPECEKVSCRRCKAITHIPITCEQHAKDNKINSRHKVEEAMTAALIRSCNKCKKTFIKDYGCNKMSCNSCGNKQCYVCSKDVHDYNHFDQTTRPNAGASSSKSKLCPLYDNVEERHEREVKEAEAAARAQVVEDNPDVTAEDLEIKVSDAVKQTAADRVQQAGGVNAGFAPFLAGGAFLPQLQHYQPYVHQPLAHGAYRRADGRAALDAELERARARVRERDAQQAARGAARHRALRNWNNPAQPPAQPPAHVQGYIPVLGFNPPAQPAAPRWDQYYPGQPQRVEDNVLDDLFGGMNDLNGFDFGDLEGLGGGQNAGGQGLGAGEGQNAANNPIQNIPFRHQPQAIPGAYPDYLDPPVPRQRDAQFQQNLPMQQAMQARQQQQAMQQALLQNRNNNIIHQHAAPHGAAAPAPRDVQQLQQRNLQNLEQLRQQHQAILQRQAEREAVRAQQREARVHVAEFQRQVREQGGE
ncbi:uncharacterized protein LTR77_008998 [Saxophila tyrrhenica]|uniref:RING-type domain-containing protein n=1 Tax=Saxophila tyrrhenica TaxID=1690608 RepID=A0AAV9P262_9PEZI|nr:hypothetical protein LTR77_008998 [Saxophila tyrrhenica]